MSCTPRSTLTPSRNWQVLVNSEAGAMPPAVLENLITSVKSLDMNPGTSKSCRPQGQRSPMTA